jgi:hypothetical protein
MTGRARSRNSSGLSNSTQTMPKHTPGMPGPTGRRKANQKKQSLPLVVENAVDYRQELLMLEYQLLHPPVQQLGDVEFVF